MRALGYDKVSHFAKFLGKDAGSVNKYVKNKRNIGGGFIFDLKAKIPALNIEYFSKENEPMFIEEVQCKDHRAALCEIYQHGIYGINGSGEVVKKP